MTKNYLQITKWLKMYILENQLKTPNFLKLYNCRSPRLLVLLQPCLWHGGSSASASRPPRPGLERTRGPLSWELRASNCQTRAVSTRSRHPAAAQLDLMSKSRQKSRFKKFVKMTDHINACNSLTNFEEEGNMYNDRKRKSCDYAETYIGKFIKWLQAIYGGF